MRSRPSREYNYDGFKYDFTVAPTISTSRAASWSQIAKPSLRSAPRAKDPGPAGHPGYMYNGGWGLLDYGLLRHGRF